MKALKPFTALLAVTLALAAQAGSSRDKEEDKDKPWKEAEVALPAAPSAADLIPLYVSATATQSFAVDAKSISVDEDKVVRYTLVATSASGAKNVSYEGIRCNARTWKSYAYGRTDGSWARARQDEWKTLDGKTANGAQAVLAHDFFCDGSMPAERPDRLAADLRASARK